VLQYRQEYVGSIEYRYTTAGGTVLEAAYHSEGRVYNNGGTLRYEYAIRDHLGNTRLTFTDKNGNGVVDVTNTASNEILQESHFYPFGLDMAGPWMNDAALDNLYKYNGKELNGDFGLNWMDYGARWYDGALGRWWCVDGLSELYIGWSTYQYVQNSPAILIDPNGLSNVRPGSGKYPGADDGENENKQETLSEQLNKKRIWESANDEDGPLDEWRVIRDKSGNILKTERVGYKGFDQVDYIYNYVSDPDLGEVWESSESQEVAFSLGLLDLEGPGYRMKGGFMAPGALGTLDDLSDPLFNLITLGAGSRVRSFLTLKTSASGEYAVYRGLDNAGLVRYVGITSRNPTIRFTEHRLAIGTGRDLLRYRVVSGATNLSKIEARIWETRLMIQYGLGKNGGPLLNKIYSISPRYWSKFGVK
jgi:RHS repeat-associated protein